MQVVFQSICVVLFFLHILVTSIQIFLNTRLEVLSQTHGVWIDRKDANILIIKNKWFLLYESIRRSHHSRHIAQLSNLNESLCHQYSNSCTFMTYYTQWANLWISPLDVKRLSNNRQWDNLFKIREMYL